MSEHVRWPCCAANEAQELRLDLFLCGRQRRKLVSLGERRCRFDYVISESPNFYSARQRDQAKFAETSAVDAGEA